MATFSGDVQYSQVMGQLPTPVQKGNKNDVGKKDNWQGRWKWGSLFSLPAMCFQKVDTKMTKIP